MTATPDLKPSGGKFWRTIQGKLIFLLLVLFVPTLLIQVYIYHDRFETRRAEELQANLEIARAVAKAFETFVLDVLHQDYAIGLALTSSRLTTEEQNQILDKNRAIHPAVSSFSYVDPEGFFVAASFRDSIGMNVRDRKYIEDILAGRDWSVSDLVFSTTTGAPVFTINRAVRDDQAKLLGIVVATIPADRLDEVLGIERAKGGAVSLIDSRGMLVYRYPSIKITREERNWLQLFPGVLEHALEGNEVSRTVFASYEGKKRIIGLAPVASIGWAAGAGRTEAQAMKAINSTLLPQAILFLLVTCAAFGTALALSRLISTPVKRLRDHALAIGRGDADIDDTMAPAGPAELRELADSFNVMAEGLKARERSLNEQREWLRVMLTSIGDAVMATDTAGRVAFLNPVAAALTGWQVEEALTQPFQKIFRAIDEKSLEPAEDIIGRVLREGCIVALANHTALVARDGRVIPIEDSAAPIRDSSGKISGVVLVFHDVTENRRARLALLESEEHYRSLFDNMLNGYAYCRMHFEEGRPVDFTYLTVNGAFEILTGLKDVTGKKVSQVIPGIRSSDPELFEAYGRVASTGIPVRFETYVEALGMWFSISAYSPKIEHFVAVFEVITERKQTEEALCRSQSRFRLLSETAGRLLASQDPQGIVDGLCREVMEHLDCQAFFNFLVDEEMGRLHLNACAGIPDEEAAKIEWLDYGVAVCGCAARDRERIVAEDIFNTPDTRTELVKSYGIQAYACHPLMSRGRLIGTLSFGTKTRAHFSPEDLDLMKTVADQVATAMEKIELIHELRRSRDELELRVQERTEELVRSNQALQDFASIASHDLQEPLRKVTSFGNMLQQKYGEPLGQGGKDYLNRMLGATSRMQALLSSLLEYSRVTTKAKPLIAVALTDIVSGVLSDLEVRIAQTGGEVQVGSLPVVEADSTQMRQLFQNLIGNGLKFHKEGEKPLIQVESSSSGDQDLQITVRDNGIGFDEKYTERIFAPFERLHGRASEYEGTGIGLAICKKIVERHGWSITAKSEPGKGSAFMITLPSQGRGIRRMEKSPLDR